MSLAALADGDPITFDMFAKKISPEELSEEYQVPSLRNFIITYAKIFFKAHSTILLPKLIALIAYH